MGGSSPGIQFHAHRCVIDPAGADVANAKQLSITIRSRGKGKQVHSLGCSHDVRGASRGEWKALDGWARMHTYTPLAPSQVTAPSSPHLPCPRRQRRKPRPRGPAPHGSCVRCWSSLTCQGGQTRWKAPRRQLRLQQLCAAPPQRWRQQQRPPTAAQPLMRQQRLPTAARPVMRRQRLPTAAQPLTQQQPSRNAAHQHQMRQQLQRTAARPQTRRQPPPIAARPRMRRQQLSTAAHQRWAAAAAAAAGCWQRGRWGAAAPLLAPARWALQHCCKLAGALLLAACTCVFWRQCTYSNMSVSILVFSMFWLYHNDFPRCIVSCMAGGT